MMLITLVLIYKMAGCFCYSKLFQMTVADYQLCHKLQHKGGVAVIVHSTKALIDTSMMPANANFIILFSHDQAFVSLPVTCLQSVVALVSLFCFNIVHGCLLAVNCSKLLAFFKSRHVCFVNKCMCLLAEIWMPFFFHAEILNEIHEKSYYKCVYGMLN